MNIYNYSKLGSGYEGDGFEKNFVALGKRIGKWQMSILYLPVPILFRNIIQLYLSKIGVSSSPSTTVFQGMRVAVLCLIFIRHNKNSCDVVFFLKIEQKVDRAPRVRWWTPAATSDSRILIFCTGTSVITTRKDRVWKSSCVIKQWVITYFACIGEIKNLYKITCVRRSGKKLIIGLTFHSKTINKGVIN